MLLLAAIVWIFGTQELRTKSGKIGLLELIFGLLVAVDLQSLLCSGMLFLDGGSCLFFVENVFNYSIGKAIDMNYYLPCIVFHVQIALHPIQRRWVASKRILIYTIIRFHPVLLLLQFILLNLIIITLRTPVERDVLIIE